MSHPAPVVQAHGCQVRWLFKPDHPSVQASNRAGALPGPHGNGNRDPGFPLDAL